MLTVHHLGTSQSERIVWLCEELGIPYDYVRHERDPVTRRAPPSYTALHPLGTAPAITDGEFSLAESGAIMEYIIHTYGNGRLTVKPGETGYADYLFWWHFANGSFMPAIMVDLVALMMGGGENEMSQAMKERGNRAYAMIEQRLGEADYFAGDKFTAADIIMGFMLTTMRMFVPRDLASFPNTRAYLQRIGARPAYQRAMAKAEPDMAPNLT